MRRLESRHSLLIINIIRTPLFRGRYQLSQLAKKGQAVKPGPHNCGPGGVWRDRVCASGRSAAISSQVDVKLALPGSGYILAISRLCPVYISSPLLIRADRR